MAAFVGLIVGIGAQVIAHQGYDATPAEGFLAYGIGFAIGMMIAREVREKHER